MDEEKVKKYIGKRVLIILKNSFQYTAVIPRFEGSGFTITDKFKKRIEIECDFIAFIELKEIKNE